jgi:hypothetical protein
MTGIETTSANAAGDAPDALLLIAPGCPHCPKVLTGLGELVKAGTIGRLEVINVATHPERAAELGIRSVPWTRIGPFELEGLQSPVELRHYAERSNDPAALGSHLGQLLERGRLDRAVSLVTRQANGLDVLVSLLGNPDTNLQVRLGCIAVLESLPAGGLPDALVTRLGEFSRHRDARLRNDACYALGLSGNPLAKAPLAACLHDEDAGVRDSAAEALTALNG